MGLPKQLLARRETISMIRRTRSILPILLVGGVVAAVLVGQWACRPPAQDADLPGPPNSPATANGSVASPARGIPAGCVAAANAPRDPKTGLPTRVIHEKCGVVLVLIPAGELVMGRADPSGGRKRVIREPFYLGETEVTVGQFRRFAEQAGYRSDAEQGVPEDPEGDVTVGGFSELPNGKGQQRQWHPGANWRNPLPNFADVIGEERLSSDWPVVQVTWHDAKRFAAHFGFALPSEVQWEYACRAGSISTFPWGEAEAGAAHANVGDLSFRRLLRLPEGGFPFDDRAATLAKAGSYRPNAWGLYDMIGNVDEWCEDEGGRSRAISPTNPQRSPAVLARTTASSAGGRGWVQTKGAASGMRVSPRGDANGSGSGSRPRPAGAPVLSIGDDPGGCRSGRLPFGCFGVFTGVGFRPARILNHPATASTRRRDFRVPPAALRRERQQTPCRNFLEGNHLCHVDDGCAG
jgi:formylglycine-generating enzyme required for sulfatase activity